MPNPTAFRWDSKLRRYRRPNGRMVGRSEVIGALNQAAQKMRSYIDVLSSQLRDGDIDIATWQNQMAKTIKKGHTYEAAAAAGGWDQVNRDDWLEVARRLKFQYKHLRQFGRDLQSGQPLDGLFRARASMYGDSVRVSFDAVARRNDERRGYTEERRHVTSGRPCRDCPHWASLGWQPIGVLPLPTENCACRSRCKCAMERRQRGSTPRRARKQPAFEKSKAVVTTVQSVERLKPQPMASWNMAEYVNSANREIEQERQALQNVLDIAEEILDQRPGLEDLASIFGAPDTGKVDLTDTSTKDVAEITAKVSARGYQTRQRLSRNRTDRKLRPKITIDSMVISKASEGDVSALQTFGRQVDHGAAWRIELITAMLVKQGTSYKTWPVFGWDAPLPEGVGEKLPKNLLEVNRLSDLMRTEDGRRFWAENGVTLRATFDLAPGNLSRLVWARYLEIRILEGKGIGNRPQNLGQMDVEMVDRRSLPSLPEDDNVDSAVKVWEEIELKGPEAYVLGDENVDFSREE